MIAALIAGRLDEDKFPGRNTIPILGRPMMTYPLMAALHAKRVDRVFVTTDAPAIARIAGHHAVEVIERPVELSGPSVVLEDILAHAYEQLTITMGLEVEALVVLLCNAPTVTSGLIDHGVEALLKIPSLDAVMSVSRHNEYSPSYALRLDRGGVLQPFMPVQDRPTTSEDVYFPDALLWVLRPQSVLNRSRRDVPPNWIVNCGVLRVQPLIHEGYGDVDYQWQVPAVEAWLRRHGFSEACTPYSVGEPARPEAPRTPTRTAGSAPAPTLQGPVLITTVPFGEPDRRPLDLLEEAGIPYIINPIGRKLKESELAELIGGYSALIAGTEPITAKVIDRAQNLRLISRVGVGVDNVDFAAARRCGIEVSYTPEAPVLAVAELTIGVMLSLLRFISEADRGLRNGVWHRSMGRRLAETVVGVIGVGRIGKQVIRNLRGFSPRILANDLAPDSAFGVEHAVRWVDKDVIYREADLITLHLPLTRLTKSLITKREIALLKPGALLINTSRGNMIDERDLADAIREGRVAGAAIDVFGQEPYSGELTTLDRCLLTCHMGSMSLDCRARMELEATEEVIRFFRDEPLRQRVKEADWAP